MMVRRWLLATAAFLLAVLVLVPVTASAQGTSDDEIQVLAVVEDEDGQVTLEIAIPPSIGEVDPVAANFALTENGEVLGFRVTPLLSQIDVVVVLDTSGSMRGEALEAARSAASSFIQQLPPETRVGVVSFGATAQVDSQVGLDRDAALAAVGSLSASGETAMWDGLTVAGDLIADLGSERSYVVVLSDGEDTVSSATQTDAADRLVDAGAGLYAIAIESPDTNLESLGTTVDQVGGQFLSAESIQELDALYVDIAARLASRYELVFETETQNRRSVVVSVAADGAVATARTTIAGPEAPVVVQDAPARVLNIEQKAQLGLVAPVSPGLLGRSSMLWLGVAAMFVSFAVLGGLLIVPSRQVRLATVNGEARATDLNTRMTDATDRLISNRDEDGRLDASLDAAGLTLRPGEFVLISLAIISISAMVFSVLGGPLLGVLGAAFAMVMIFGYVSRRASRRRNRFADQLTDTLGIMTGALRAGRGLPQAIELVSEEAASPSAEQFRRIVFETRVGRDLTASMISAADRMKSKDLEWVARAVDINRELGGDLTEVLDNVADTIRDRRRVARQVQALSAEGRASGWVLLALPFLMFFFLVWRTPESASKLTNTTPGQTMLALGLFSMFLGYLWIRKLVDLKY